MKTVVATCLCILVLALTANATPKRQIAITVDDLPTGKDLVEMRELTGSLIKDLKAAGVPAIGFVVESALHEQGELQQRSALLGDWSDAGLELGNHTNSHLNLNSTPLAAYESDTLNGERTIREVLRAKRKVPRYFRPPYLLTGKDAHDQKAFTRFLKERGFTLAPVTIDSRDYFFAASYREALAKQDKTAAERIRNDYVDYLERATLFAESSATKVVGRDIPQILRVHAMRLTVESMERIIQMLRARGYEFITLEAALKDRAYRLPTAYYGGDPVPWIERWAISKHITLKDQPGMPSYAVRPY